MGDCILKRCAHPASNNCSILGTCGAAVAVESAIQDGLYVAQNYSNPTVAALVEEGVFEIYPDVGVYRMKFRLESVNGTD